MARMTRRQALAGMVASPLALCGRARADERPTNFSMDEVVDSGHKFFGTVSRGLAEAVQEAARRWGLPNAYVLGQEASGAFVGGLRYGEGKMYTRNAGDPAGVTGRALRSASTAGADGDRTMMLVYNLPAVAAIYQRFGGADGSAYFIGGFGFTALDADGVIVVPIRTGVGARLGVNVGYLKFTPSPTWNPF